MWWWRRCEAIEMARYLAGGSIPTELDLFEWALEVEKREQ